MIKNKKLLKSELPVLPPMLTNLEWLLTIFFITIIDIFSFPNSIFNLLSNYNFNTCCIYGNKD